MTLSLSESKQEDLEKANTQLAQWWTWHGLQGTSTAPGIDLSSQWLSTTLSSIFLWYLGCEIKMTTKRPFCWPTPSSVTVYSNQTHFQASKTSWSRWQVSNGDENITVLSTSGLHCWLQMCAAMFFSLFSCFNPGLCWAQQGFTAPQNSAAENSGDGCERSWAWFCGISTLVFVATPTLDFVATPCPTFTVAPFCLLPQIAGFTHRIIGSCTTCLHSAVH